MIARYDFSAQVASFDFFTWLVHVQSLGATEIVLDTTKFRLSKWDIDEAWKRYHSVIEEGSALAGLPSREGTDGEVFGSHNLKDIAALPTFNRLRTVLPKKNARYTVTLRRSTHNPHRNSDEPVWREFAKLIGALVIEDYSVVPIHLYERVALYAGAEMNFGVTNGPLALLYLTNYPFMMFDCISSKKGFAGHGIKKWTQLPWASKDQILVWDQKPKLNEIVNKFELWLETC